MGVETAVMGAGALLGGLAGSQSKGGGTTTTNQTQNQTSTTALPSWQQPYVDFGLSNAQTATQNALANPVYQGNRVAGLTAEQIQNINKAMGSSGQMFGAANNLMATGQNLMGTGAQFGQNAANLYGTYAGVDPTQTILQNAAQYANNPYTQGIVDAASRDVTRNLYETQLPTLSRAATGTGNLNSTRAGVESAIATRGAADRLADVSNQIRGQFFGQGLTQAQNQYNQNLQNSLGINAQLANAYGAGVSGIGAGGNLAGSAFNLGSTAGGQLQAQNQAQINADMQKFSEQTGMPLNILNQYMQMAGKDFGRTTTSTGTSTGSSVAPTTGGGWQGALTGALGGGLGGLGLYGQLGGANTFGNLGSNLQAQFARTPLGSSGFGSGLAYGNQDLGVNF